jgi:hypothetical protein
LTASSSTERVDDDVVEVTPDAAEGLEDAGAEREEVEEEDEEEEEEAEEEEPEEEPPEEDDKGAPADEGAAPE